MTQAKVYKRRFWTEQETEFMKRFFKELTYEDLAFFLKRTVSSVKSKTYQLKLKKLCHSASHKTWVSRDSSDLPWNQWNISKHVLDLMREGYI